MNKLDYTYYPDKDILVIEGIHYSGNIFRTLSMPRHDRFYKFERTKELPETVTIHSFESAEDAVNAPLSCDEPQKP